MAVTVNAGSSATFGIDAAASLTITNSGRDAVGVITFTSAAPDSGVPSFTAPIQEKVWGPFLAPMQVTIAVTNGTCSYQPNGNTGGFGYDTSGNITGLVDGAGNTLYATTAVGTSRSLTDADNGRTLECTATVTLTVPTGLMSGFGCAIIPSGTTSIASSGGALLNGATTTLTRAEATNAIFAIVPRASASNSYVVTGT